MREVAKSFGWPADKDFNDVSELDSHVPVELRQALRQFFRWVHECYQASGAMELSVSCGFPNVANQYAIVPFALIRPQGESASDAAVTISDVVVRDIKFAPLHILAQIPTDKLIGIRNEYGKDYLSNLSRWRARDPNTSAEGVGDALEDYAKELVKQVQASGAATQTSLEIKIGRWLSTDRPFAALEKLLDNALKISRAASLIPSATEFATILGRFLSLAKDGFSLIRFLDSRPDHPRVRIPGDLDLVQNVGAVTQGALAASGQ
jgi:hypothetical protein